MPTINLSVSGNNVTVSGLQGSQGQTYTVMVKNTANNQEVYSKDHVVAANTNHSVTETLPNGSYSIKITAPPAFLYEADFLVPPPSPPPPGGGGS